MGGQSQPSGSNKGGTGQSPYNAGMYGNYGGGYGMGSGYNYGGMTPWANPAQQGSYYSAGGSMRPPQTMDYSGMLPQASAGSKGGVQPQQQGNPIGRTMDTGSLFGSPYTQKNPISTPMTTQPQFGPLPPGQANPYLGNTPDQNGLVFTNGQYGFGNATPAQLAPGTAAMLGFTRQGNNWVNAQGQVVGTV